MGLFSVAAAPLPLLEDMPVVTFLSLWYGFDSTFFIPGYFKPLLLLLHRTDGVEQWGFRGRPLGA